MPVFLGYRLWGEPSTDAGVEWMVCRQGFYELGTLRMMAVFVEAGATVLDVGANIGLMTVWCSKLVGPHGRVIAFEPHPVTFELLKQNVTLNDASNITCQQLALSDRSGMACLYDRTDKSRGSASMTWFQSGDKASEISMTTIDDYVATNALRDISFVKIDVEGFEDKVLGGARQLLTGPTVPVFCIECNQEEASGRMSARRIYDLILSTGSYEIYQPIAGKEDVSHLIKVNTADEMPYYNNIYALSKEHVRRYGRWIQMNTGQGPT